MNLMPWRNADADTKHDVIVMLLIHGVLYLTNLVLYLMPEPVFFHNLLEGESLPICVRQVLQISNHIRNNFLFLYLPVTVALPWLDAIVYITLRQRFGKLAASVWVVAIFLMLLAALVFFGYGLTAVLRG
ncbi:MAG: hypothetical protein ACO1QS_20550 [Verrucomicrobiota bacterium]